MRGSIDQNDDYTSKDGEYTDWGVRPRPGERTDLQGAVGRLLSGEWTIDDAVINVPSVHARAARTLEAAADIAARKRQRTEATTIIWIYGPTGTGKSHTVHARAPLAYSKPLGDGDLKWWDNYRGEEDVWFDDFRGQIAYAELLTLADKWPKTVSRRGQAPVPFMARRIWITSPRAPEEIYRRQVDQTDSIQQLERRISERIHLTEKYIESGDAAKHSDVIDLSQDE